MVKVTEEVSAETPQCHTRLRETRSPANWSLSPLGIQERSMKGHR